ncbi:MAG: HD-GYP domain-containing protein [Akkermansiaceae bacterium]|nr:HD-GYP domain-containing protein [Armatimonadota bacterium]
MNMQSFPRLAQAYVVSVILAGISALAICAVGFPIPVHDWMVVIPGLLLSAGASFLRVPVVGFQRANENSVQNSTISLGLVPTFLLLLAFGPFVGSLAGVVTAMIGTMYPKRSFLVQILFSISAVVLSVLAACPVLMLAGVAHPRQTFPPVIAVGGPSVIWQAFATLGAGAIYFFVNTFLVAVAINLTSRTSSWREAGALWRDNYFWMFPGYVAGSAAAALMYVMLPYALLYWHSALALATLVLPVPFLIYYSARYHRDRDVNHRSYIAELERGREELRGLYTATVESFALAIDAKDRYTQEHIQRVKSYAMDLAREMELSGMDLKAVEYGALLHDIGKIAIPESILCKPGKLTPDEFEKMKTHTIIGAKILEPVRFPFPVVDVVRSHHERYDGSGYPDGLKGDEIPIGARILAVTDVYDALTTDRAYRRAWSRNETMLYLQKHMGSHFDPHVVSAFLRILRQEDERTAAMINGPMARIDGASASVG